MNSKENLHIGNENFYSSDADPSEVAGFYCKALDVSGSVVGDTESRDVV